MRIMLIVLIVAGLLACNRQTDHGNCHIAANHPFNVIRIPDMPPVTNQVFENSSK